MNRILFIPAILLCIILAGCGKKNTDGARKSCTQECPEYNAEVRFMGYSLAEIDTIMVYTYEYNQKFDTRMDSSLHTYTGNREFAFPNLRIGDDADYIIMLPAVNKQYRVHSLPNSPTTESYDCKVPADGRVRPQPPCISVQPNIIVDGDTLQLNVYAERAYELILRK